MALPFIPIRTNETVRVVSPWDTDLTGPPDPTGKGPATLYLQGDWTQIEHLTAGPGATWIEVRGLTEVELDVAKAEVAGRASGDVDSPLTTPDVVAWRRSLQWELPRYGLVSVAGVDLGQPERHFGRPRWSNASLEAIDGRTRQWLGRVIDRLSELGPTSAVSSGSLPGKAGGTTAGSVTTEASGDGTPPPSTASASALAGLAARDAA